MTECEVCGLNKATTTRAKLNVCATCANTERWSIPDAVNPIAWHRRKKRMPHKASWKYIEAIGDHFMEPYGSMCYIWCERVIARAKNIARIRRQRGFF